MKETSAMLPAPAGAVARPWGKFGFSFGRRFFLLLGVGLVWLVPVFINRRYAYAMLVWDLLVLLAWFADLAALPKPALLQVQRIWRSPLSLGTESRVEISITSKAKTTLLVRVRDDIPSELHDRPGHTRLTVPSLNQASAEYSITPRKRGEAKVGPVYLRYETPMRMAERWATADLSQKVVVYPDLREARRQAMFLMQSRQIDLEKRLTRSRGAGHSFESLREYREGDDFADICWTATARRGKLVTRLYELEKSQTIWLVLDTGRLMRTYIESLSKLDYAIGAGLALAQVALLTGDRVGLLAYARNIQSRVPPERGTAQLRQVLEALAIVKEDVSEADHLQAASRLMRDQKRRSLVVWITDLAETAMTPEVIEAASTLVSRHLVLFVVIGQPDLRAAAVRSPKKVAEMYEVSAAQEILHRRELLLARLRERGALAVEAESAELAPLLVNSYLEVKQRSLL